MQKKDEISFNRETAGILGTVGATVATVATAGTVVGASLTEAGAAQTEMRAATGTKAIGAVTGAKTKIKKQGQNQELQEMHQP